MQFAGCPSLAQTESVWKSMTVEQLQALPLLPLPRDRFGWTAMHWAARCSTKAVMVSLRERMHKEMLSHQMFDDELNRAAGPSLQQVTPLHLAVMYNRSPAGAHLVHWMLQHGARVDVLVDGKTVDQLARQYKNVHVSTVLCEWRASMRGVPRAPKSPTKRQTDSECYVQQHPRRAESCSWLAFLQCSVACLAVALGLLRAIMTTATVAISLYLQTCDAVVCASKHAWVFHNGAGPGVANAIAYHSWCEPADSLWCDPMDAVPPRSAGIHAISNASRTRCWNRMAQTPMASAQASALPLSNSSCPAVVIEAACLQSCIHVALFPPRPAHVHYVQSRWEVMAAGWCATSMYLPIQALEMSAMPMLRHRDAHVAGGDRADACASVSDQGVCIAPRIDAQTSAGECKLAGFTFGGWPCFVLEARHWMQVVSLSNRKLAMMIEGVTNGFFGSRIPVVGLAASSLLLRMVIGVARVIRALQQPPYIPFEPGPI